MSLSTALNQMGITGNTHFPMMDLNNVRIADLLSRFLTPKPAGLGHVQK